MDLLFKRYANPFMLLDGYIQTGRFCEFIHSFVEQNNEDDRWEFFLHKVFGMTYEEFCKDAQQSQSVQAMSEDEIKTTVQDSLDILGSFHPE